jgi:hypothetical protein
MTVQSTEPYRSRSLLPWIMLAAGLIIGFFAGRQTMSMQMAKIGDCVRSDTTYAALNVTQQSCTATCPSCMWVQDR